VPDKAHQKRSVSDDWILNRIQKGKNVHLRHAVIKGGLRESRLDLPTKHVNRTEYQLALGLPLESKIISSDIEIINSEFEGFVDFSNCIFEKPASFKNTSFMDVRFDGASFSGDAMFDNASFRSARFIGTSFRYAGFSKTSFRFADFDGASFDGYTWFTRASFEFARFVGASFSRHASFWKASFCRDASFKYALFNGEFLTFTDASFAEPHPQEYACRKAKNVLEKNGDREEAGYNFYLEMDGKRRQKPWYIRYPEFVFIQMIFGYGVHPFRLMFCWLLAATIFALFYALKGGIISKLPASSLPEPISYFVECFYFSIVTAVTPGYGKYELTSWIYQVVASFEAIFGTFMWAAFIATFARKYMR
jgi:uncharacterized protein YjbI with pentapeptide repeats